MTQIYSEDNLDIILNEVRDPYVRGLLDEILLRRYYEEFLTEPAACKKHHNYPGGLLDHSLCVADNVINIYWSYYYAYGRKEKFNESIAIAGALLHDIGKIHCYTEGKVDDKVVTQKTFIDDHIGHISHGYHLVRSAGEYLGTPVDILNNICHIIIASHGRKDWGSPVEPKTREAFIVHQADMIDAYMAGWENLENEVKAGTLPRIVS